MTIIKILDDGQTVSDHTFIQWKGTDVCMGWHCPDCDTAHHVDAYFCYAVKCMVCGSTFTVGTDVTLTKTKDESGSVIECYPDSDDPALLSS